MPTPIGHALAGLAVAGIATRGDASVPRTSVLVFCAVAPDLDLVLRFVDGMNHHRGPSHSVTAAVLVGVLGLVLARGRPWKRLAPWAAAAWLSHVVLDYLGVDTSPPRGEMALWPFSDAFFASPIPLFYDVPRAFDLASIRHNLTAVAIEIAILGPIGAFSWRGRRASD